MKRLLKRLGAYFYSHGTLFRRTQSANAPTERGGYNSAIRSNHGAPSPRRHFDALAIPDKRPLLVSFLLAALCVQGLSAQEAETELSTQSVKPILLEQSYFTDRVLNIQVYFDTVVTQPEDWEAFAGGYQIIDIEVSETADTSKRASYAQIRILPRRSGILNIAPLVFKSDSVRYITEGLQVYVTEPIRSDAMSLSITPNKTELYAGETLRLDLVWKCELQAGALKQLRLDPEFFNDPNIQIVIPRTTVPEDQQIGLPIGGRRVIAQHTAGQNDRTLGRIELSVFLKFKEPGNYSLPETRLSCVKLSKPDPAFGRYAAHFNNAFFETVDPTVAYDRIYTLAPPVDILVRPLPEKERPIQYSGLFAPLSIEVSANPLALEVGQLMQMEIQVASNTPHGMLDLPKLSQQRGLRERFLVDDSYGRLWDAEGTIFRIRLRPLSTSIQAIPSLSIPVFDPESGHYTTFQTKPIPIEIAQSNGRDYLPIKSFQDAAVVLTPQPEGIWQNRKAHSMNDLLNRIFQGIQTFFWPLILLAPIACALLLPIVCERRRRELNPAYCRRMEAYKAFKNSASNSTEQWQAFLRFMAVTFHANEKAWTAGDSQAALKQIEADSALEKELLTIHEQADASAYSSKNSKTRFDALDSIAKRIHQLANKALFVLIGILCLALPQNSEASDFSEAEARFAKALAAPAGSPEAEAAYKEAALKFQALAEVNTHAAEAWLNAGNAWFQASEIGRAIAAFREAELQRPFDPQITESLAAARAMTLNAVPEARNSLQKLPTYWIDLTLVMANFAFWALLLTYFRYRDRGLAATTTVIGVATLLVATFSIQRHLNTEVAGVVIVDASYGKKGPDYAYANAFNQPLHDGLEVNVLEKRGEWAQIELVDGRQCWIPSSQIQLIRE